MPPLIDTRKHKGGRPPKEEDDLRRNKVKVGFTDLEFDTVNYKAQQAGLKTSSYIHDAALSAKVRSHINDEQAGLVRDVARLGNNVNQIARQANLGRLPYIQHDCQKVIGQIGTLISRILRGGDLTE